MIMRWLLGREAQEGVLVKAIRLAWFVALLLVAVINAQTTNTARPDGFDYLKVGVYKKQEFISGLEWRDFKVSVDGKSVEVVDVREERLPLSIILIVTLGSNGRCGFTHISELSAWLSKSLHQNLGPKDQLGVVVTDPEGQILLKFGDSSKEWRDVFGDEEQGSDPWGYGQITKLSESISKEYRAFRRVTYREKGSDSAYNLHPIPEKILIAQNNYLHIALKNALQFLRRHRNSGSRPIILMANDIYNLAAFNDEDEKEISGLVASEKPVVNWIGSPVECCHLVPNKALHKSPRTKFFTDLPKRTGGRNIPCEIFRPTNSWGIERDNQKNLNKALGKLLGNLRMAYSMWLAPGDLKPGENAKVELTSRRSEGIEIIELLEADR
jgi:hypothetical protein